MKRALLMVDVQNGFIARELPVPRAAEVVPLVNRLAKEFDLVAATQDWHPADHLSFASQHPGKKPFEQGMVAGQPHTLWPDHCVAGTWGADFAEGLDTRPFAAIIRKGMSREVDSYSGFMDDNRAQTTGLAGFLREHGVQEVHLAGLALDYCVKFSALDALAAGFQAVVHAAACRAVSEAGGEAARREMQQRGIRFL